jgi:hypothetical protein
VKDEDPTTGEPQGEEIARRIAQTSDAAALLVRENEQAYGEVIWSALLAQVADWHVDVQQHGTAEASAASDRAVAALEKSFVDGDETTRTIIATGFLEMLPMGGGGRDVVERLPAALREELARMEAWKPTAG